MLPISVVYHILIVLGTSIGIIAVSLRLIPRTLVRSVLVLYAVTFCLILPAICHNFKYSAFYIKPQTSLSQDVMRKENTERIHAAMQYLQMLNTSKLHSMLSKELHSVKALDVAIGIITVSRNRHRMDSYEPKYLTQVVWRLLALLHSAQAQGFNLHVHLAVCNVDSDPGSYKEVQRLRHTIPIINRFNKLSLSLNHPLEKEKQDYVFCLNSTLKLNPRYVLLLEDDALPQDDFFPVLQHIIHTRMDNHYVDGSLVPNRNPGAYVKLYHPERLLGFISPEFERIPELLSIGLVLSTVSVLALRRTKRWGSTMDERKALATTWLALLIYFALVALAIGRVHFVEIRRLFSPHLYTMVKAPECCTPAMLFPREGGQKVATMLQKTPCKKGFGKDTAIWRWRKANGLPAYMIQPNMVTHIGLYSSLRTAILDPFIV